MSRGTIVVVDTESFVAQARKVHGELYNYEKTNYIGSRRKVAIVCKQHGLYMQLAHAHLAGQGCLRCARIAWSVSKSRPVQNVRTGHIYQSQREASLMLRVGEGVISRALTLGKEVTTVTGQKIQLKRVKIQQGDR